MAAKRYFARFFLLSFEDVDYGDFFQADLTCFVNKNFGRNVRWPLLQRSIFLRLKCITSIGKYSMCPCVIHIPTCLSWLLHAAKIRARTPSAQVANRLSLFFQMSAPLRLFCSCYLFSPLTTSKPNNKHKIRAAEAEAAAAMLRMSRKRAGRLLARPPRPHPKKPTHEKEQQAWKTWKTSSGSYQ